MTKVSKQTSCIVGSIVILLFVGLITVVATPVKPTDQNMPPTLENGTAMNSSPYDSNELATQPKLNKTVTRVSSNGEALTPGGRVPRGGEAITEDVAKEIDEGDTLIESYEEGLADFPDTPVGHLLQDHMLVIDGLGPEAEMLYQQSLDELRDHPEEAINLLVQAYDQMDQERYLDRWKVVDLLAQLQTNASLEDLAVIAGAYIPEELYPEEEGVNPRAEEVMIRRAAIRGIEDLAKRGVVEAEAELLILTESPDELVREIAVLAYLRTGIDEGQRRAELGKVLDPEDRWMLNLQQLSDVRVMPQPTSVDEMPNEPSAKTEKISSLPPQGL